MASYGYRTGVLGRFERAARGETGFVFWPCPPSPLSATLRNPSNLFFVVGIVRLVDIWVGEVLNSSLRKTCGFAQ